MRLSKAERDTSFAAFMDQTGPALLWAAWFLTGDANRAQELTQAAFVKTYVVWHKFDHDTTLAYARRCLVNHKIDVWRATRHEVADLTSAGLERGHGHSGIGLVPGINTRITLTMASATASGSRSCKAPVTRCS
jgi:DNA-directed RNA polymerase specialized sigma24 family protein